jgi:predicted ATPase
VRRNSPGLENPGDAFADGRPRRYVNEEKRKSALRSFLLERRARIKPEDAGLPRIGRRRVEGLRREEVAQLAGVSASWYTLFETARDIRVSPRMLQNVAQALRLSREETIYLFSLAIDEMPIMARSDVVGTADSATALRPRTNNLPALLTSFHGRRRRAEHLGNLVAGRRLVTLTGLGGIGKTRLAIEVGRKLVDRFSDGVWLVEFAAVADAALVALRVADVMGIQERPGVPILDALVPALRNDNVLLIFDNCEHLLGEIAQVAARLLTDCPRVQILATSREPLRISGERVERVPPLSIPDPDAAPLSSIDDLQTSAAVQLFLDRATDVAPDFLESDHPPESELRALVAICRRLDGIPLAIELAASRMNVLTLPALAERLEHRFQLLVGGSVNVLPRQQTLLATLDWSHDLLSGREKTVFRRLGVFAGGWTLEAAQAICSDDQVAAVEVFQILTSLVEKSLVVVQTDTDEPRYRLLDTMRDYALERLADEGEYEHVARKHAEFAYLLARRADASIGDVAILLAIQPLRVELDNLRAALHWALGEDKDVRLGSRLAASFGLSLSRLMLYVEAERWCERALAALGSEPDRECEAGVQRVLSLCGFFSNKPERIIEAGRRSEALYRTVAGAELARSHVLAFLGFALHRLDREREADEVTGEAVTLARNRGNRWYTAFALCYRGLARSHDRRECGALLDEAAELWKDLGPDAGFELFMLSFVAFSAGELERAQQYVMRSLAGYQRFGLHDYVAMCEVHLAAYALEAGDAETTRTAARHALVLARTTNVTTHSFQLMAIRSLAGAAALKDDPVRAARLLGAGQLDRGVLGWTRDLQEQSRCTQTIARIHGLGFNEETLASLMAEGRLWPFERAIDEALSSSLPS